MVCEILWSKCICTMTVTFEYERQSHSLFPMFDYVGIHIKINSRRQCARYHHLMQFRNDSDLSP